MAVSAMALAWYVRDHYENYPTGWGGVRSGCRTLANEENS
jgi:hypothetical protein